MPHSVGKKFEQYSKAIKILITYNIYFIKNIYLYKYKNYIKKIYNI